MRKPRNYDADLKALDDKARQLKDRKLRQLGELVIATGADVLEAEVLAGALLAAGDNSDAAAKEVWRKRGAGFFRTPARISAGGNDRGTKVDKANDGGAESAAAEPGAA